MRRFGRAVLGAFGKSARWYVKSDVWPWVFALVALGFDVYVFTKFIQAKPNPPLQPGFIFGHHSTPSLPAFPLVWVVFAGVGLVAIYILVAFAANDWFIKAYHFILIVVWLVLSFSWIYFQQGNQRLGFDLYPNFGHELSKNDALYFTVGTLSTAGTGNLSPKTPNARTAVMVQMSLDVVVLVIGVAGLVRRPQPRSGLEGRDSRSGE